MTKLPREQMLAKMRFALTCLTKPWVAKLVPSNVLGLFLTNLIIHHNYSNFMNKINTYCFKEQLSYIIKMYLHSEE